MHVIYKRLPPLPPTLLPPPSSLPHVFGDGISLCSPVCPGTHYIDQADQELTGICLPMPLACWVKGARLHHLDGKCFIEYILCGPCINCRH